MDPAKCRLVRINNGYFPSVSPNPIQVKNNLGDEKVLTSVENDEESSEFFVCGDLSHAKSEFLVPEKNIEPGQILANSGVKINAVAPIGGERMGSSGGLG